MTVSCVAEGFAGDGNDVRPFPASTWCCWALRAPARARRRACWPSATSCRTSPPETCCGARWPTAPGSEARSRPNLDRGELVSDQVMSGLILQRIDREDCARGFILEGYPRKLAQAELLDGILAELGRRIEQVILLDVPDDVIVSRLKGRLIHPGSGRTYHRLEDPPKKPGVDDLSGEPLVERDDDREEVVRDRLRVYHQHAAGVADFYRNRDQLVVVDGQPGHRPGRGCGRRIGGSARWPYDRPQVHHRARRHAPCQSGRPPRPRRGPRRRGAGCQHGPSSTRSRRSSFSPRVARRPSRATAVFPRPSAPRSTTRSFTESRARRSASSDGDILSVDCGVILDGFFGDAAVSFGVGHVNGEAERLMKVTKRCLDNAVEAGGSGQTAR